MLSNWLVVVDVDAKSQHQKSFCASNKPDLKGMIDCGDIDNTSIPICHSVTHFPAFCHVPTNSCVYGLRDTLAELNVLTTLVKETLKEPTQSNTQPSTQTSDQ